MPISTPIRMSGMQSGMDTDTLIKKLMQAERMPIDTMKQKVQTLTWQRDAYRDLNSAMFTFRASATNFSLASTFQARNVTSSNDSIASVVNQSALSDATYTMSVAGLAKSATLMSDSNSTTNRMTTTRMEIQGTKALGGNDFSAGKSFQITSGASTATINLSKKYDSSTDAASVDALVSDIQAQIDASPLTGTLKVSVDSKNRLSFYSTNNSTLSLSSTDTATDNALSQFGIASGAQSISKGVDTSESLINVLNRFGGYNSSTFTWKTNLHDELMTATGMDLNPANPDPTKETVGSKFNFAAATNYDAANAKLEVNGQTYSILTDKTSFDNMAYGTKVAYIDKTAGTIEFRNRVADNSRIALDSHTFDITGTSYNQDGTTRTMTQTIDANTSSMSGVLGKVNGSLGWTGFYDANSDRISMTAGLTGDNNPSAKDISLGGDFLTSVLHLGTTAAYTEGADASLTINGMQTTRKSNTFDLNGLSVTLKDVTNKSGSDVPLTISTGRDTQKVFDNIKNFIQGYNDLVDKFSKAYNEDRYPSYQPLTDDQRSSMSADQVKQWEDKAKSGMLHHDDMLDSSMNSMRRAVGDPVQGLAAGAVNVLSDIGITTGAYQNGGKLFINETQLKKAISEKPDEVQNLFTFVSADGTQKGVAGRLFDSASKSITQFSTKVGSISGYDLQNSAIGKEMSSLNVRISDAERRATDTENSYYKKFAAMEKALSAMQNQTQQMLSKLGA